LEETPANPLLKQEVTSQPGGWKGKGKEEENGMEVWFHNLQTVVASMAVGRLGSCLY